MRKFLGIFVNPVYVQNEGLQRVFDNLESVATRAICIVPSVARPAEAGKGRRFPDLHVDGFERLVARPVWGQQEINLERFLVYTPDLQRYQDTPYQPPVDPAPADVDTTIPHKMILEAHKRGMKAHILIHPFLPPGLRTEDQPQYIDGSGPVPPRVAQNACLNSPAAEAYGLALIEDTLQNFPDADGLIPDWVEHGAYHFKDHFTCFCPHCEKKALEQGFEWELIKKDVMALWNWFHSLTPKELQRSQRILATPLELLEQLTHHPGWLHFLRFKANSVVNFYRKSRQLLDNLGLENTELSARGWPPPWNRSSGMDYRSAAEVCTAVTPKLFTFDYSALPRWYGQTLLDWNPELSESGILDALVEWMNLPDDNIHRSFSHYHIPAPMEFHPARLETYAARIAEVTDQVRGKSLCHPFAHAYLPEPQWKRMISIIGDSRADGMWIQMYGYLSDRKLDILRNMWQA